MLSIHDNRVYAYSVLTEAGVLSLHTEFLDGERPQYTDVIFRGVLTHYFRSVLPVSILFGIEEASLEDLIRTDWPLFQDLMNAGWPVPEYRSAGELAERLQEQERRAYIISSSYGMDGWVLARSIELVERPSRSAAA